MAQVKTARLVEAQRLDDTTRLLELEPAEPLGFVGGQYVIVNSGVALPGGKLAKRAYSILSPDARQDRVQIAVRRIGAGPCSSYLHGLAVGDTVEYSGPWGKYLADDSRPRPTFLLATDTGITAALGLVRGTAFAPQAAQAQLVWMRQSDGYFLADALVRALAGIEVLMVALPPVGHPERVAVAQASVAERIARRLPESVFLSGDGAVLYPVRDQLVAAGVSGERVRLESFFNNPEKKST